MKELNFLILDLLAFKFMYFIFTSIVVSQVPTILSLKIDKKKKTSDNSSICLLNIMYYIQKKNKTFRISFTTKTIFGISQRALENHKDLFFHLTRREMLLTKWPSCSPQLDSTLDGLHPDFGPLTSLS